MDFPRLNPFNLWQSAVAWGYAMGTEVARQSEARGRWEGDSVHDRGGAAWGIPSYTSPGSRITIQLIQSFPRLVPAAHAVRFSI